MSSDYFLYQAKENLQRAIGDAKTRDPPSWGFVIYRTAYGPTTDASWQLLLAAIHSNVRASVLDNRTHNPNENPPRFDDEETRLSEEFLALFKLKLKEDQSMLDGASMDRVREVINETDPPTGEVDGAGRVLGISIRDDVFLYVDDQVLDTIETADASSGVWVKAVELGYEPQRHQGNARVGPQAYWGYMKLYIDSLLQLWQDLEGRPISRIAPKNINEEDLRVWDGLNLSSR